MARSPNMFAPYFLGLEMMRISMEAQAVIAMRTAGMMGLWATHPAEVSRMFREKPEAAAAAWFGAMQAMLRGGSSETVARAALRPIGRRTKSNARRLARLGPPGICG